MNSISSVARPGEVKGLNGLCNDLSQREEALKLPQILLIRIDLLWATKLERFVAVRFESVNKIAEVWGRNHQSLAIFFFQKNNAF